MTHTLRRLSPVALVALVALLTLITALALTACSSEAETESAAAAERAQAAERAASQDAATAAEQSSNQDPGEITVYSGRSESLVGALLEQFEADTGIRVKVRYAGTAQLAVAILEEGSRSPADVYFAQDAGALGALADAGALVALPSALLDRVDADFRDAQGRWVGTSGRARVLVISTERVADPPASVFDLTSPSGAAASAGPPPTARFRRL